jgi:cell division protein FtsQ
MNIKSLPWQNIRLFCIIFLMIFLYAFTSKRNENRKISKTEVVFVGKSTLFVAQKTVNNLLIENFADAKSIRKLNLNLNKLENTVDKHLMIEKSQVFLTIDGTLKAVVKQKTPIARVFDSEGSFYIDYQGGIMPLSDLNTARVPLILGEITAKNKAQIFDLSKQIFDDEFLKKNIIGLQILPDGSIKMTNRNFNFEIDFGNTINIETKLKNYKAFFQKAILDSSLYRYKKINLRFAKQVVCTK